MMLPGEPPADDVAEVLEQLRQAREELTDAGRIVHMLRVADADDAEMVGHRLRRHLYEVIVATRRVELWAGSVAQLERKARGMGLQP